MRTVLFHYHLFKNAGTSLDAVLRKNFPNAWEEREFGAGPAAQIKINEWVTNSPSVVAFSSHTAELPPPESIGVKVIPLIFLRHPLDRIASAYSFESRQGGESFGSVLARNTSLSGYIDVRLSIPNDHQCRNFHATRLAKLYPPTLGDEATRARKALIELPFVGIVERFSESLQVLKELIAHDYPGFEIEDLSRNVSPDRGKTLDDKLETLRKEIGGDAYERLHAANKLDLQIYDDAIRRRP